MEYLQLTNPLKICPRYFLCRWMMRQSHSFVLNLVVIYHLVISYPQQRHIGINVNDWYVILISNLNTCNVTFCIFLCRTWNNFYNLLVMIVICNEKQTNWLYNWLYVFHRKQILEVFVDRLKRFWMPCSNINLQQGSSFKTIPFKKSFILIQS